MAIVVAGSGSQSMATVGTEKSLLAPTTASFFQLWLDTNALVSGETLTVLVYRKVLSASTKRIVDSFIVDPTATGYQPNVYSVAYPSTNYIEFSITQTGGTARTIDWAVLQW